MVWLVPFDIVFSVLRFEPVPNRNWFLAVQRQGLNSLNSALDYSKYSFKTKFMLFALDQVLVIWNLLLRFQ